MLVQLVALVLLQVMVLLPPSLMVLGEALTVTVGASGRAETFTVVLFSAVVVPSVPVQVMVYVYAPVVRVPVLSVPLVPLLPVQAPLAVQLVALVLDQVTVLSFPSSIVLGLALMVTVGASWVTVTVTESLAAPQVTV